MIEIWKDIPSYEGKYQVSNLGRVKSLRRNKEKLLKYVTTKDGYYQVCLQVNGKQISIKVHQLVAIAFLNHTPCGMKLIIDHKNDIKTDNRVENLHVVTNRYNVCKTQNAFSSKYKGVCWDKSRNKWISYIKINGKRMHLGRFDCEIEASLTYENKVNEITKGQ